MKQRVALRTVKKRTFYLSLVLTLAAVLCAGSSWAAVCSFNAAASAMAFGVLDPALATNVTVNTIVRYRCAGAPPRNFAITDNDGLYETGPNLNRMRHAVTPTEFIPYALTYVPAAGVTPGPGWQNLTVTGVVQGVNYQDAAQGNYSDSVILTILP